MLISLVRLELKLIAMMPQYIGETYENKSNEQNLQAFLQLLEDLLNYKSPNLYQTVQ